MELLSSKPQEIPENQELLIKNWVTAIFLQRHARYNSDFPKDFDHPTAEEKATLGHVVEEGRIDTIKATRRRLDLIFEGGNPNVDFLVMNSPTHWLDDERFGQRARETAEIIQNEIQAYLAEKKVESGKVLNLERSTNNKQAFRGGVSRPDERLEESKIFDSKEFSDFLTREYKGQSPDFWLNFYRDTHKDKREEAGVEGPADIASRLNELLAIVSRGAAAYHEKHEGRRLVVWIVSHGDVLEPFAIKKFGVSAESVKFNYNETIAISVDNETKVNANMDGLNFEIKFPTQGLPKAIE
jgi:hypothetical protein